MSGSSLSLSSEYSVSRRLGAPASSHRKRNTRWARHNSSSSLNSSPSPSSPASRSPPAQTKSTRKRRRQDYMHVLKERSSRESGSGRRLEGSLMAFLSTSPCKSEHPEQALQCPTLSFDVTNKVFWEPTYPPQFLITSTRHSVRWKRCTTLDGLFRRTTGQLPLTRPLVSWLPHPQRPKGRRRRVNGGT